MQLKRIELEGFKSFADRTVIPVQRGLTGIVGPNGCGKSNVVDALLWVMGERSAKALRADAMEDVIFKGAEGRAPAPYAVVEVILSDTRGQVVEAGAELAVGRRLFRTGESEFLVQGRKVRRKDVRDLLMDTGLGVRGYMVLAQGKIDAVLAANPAERRSVFEEAAGISKYKARKLEAQRKLEGAAADLARVEDVLGEVARNVRSLRYQAGKVRRFLELRDRYRQVRVEVALAEAARLRADEERLRAQAGDLEQRVTALRSEREQAEARLRSLRREEETLRQRHEGLREEAARAKERAAGLEERSRGLEARAGELEHRHGAECQRLQELQRLESEQLAAVHALEEERGRQEAAHAHVDAALTAAEAAFQGARADFQTARNRMEELRRGLLDALHERTLAQNALTAAAERRSAAEGGCAALLRRRSDLAAETASVAAELAAADSELAAAAESLSHRESRAGELAETAAHLRAELETFTEAAGTARQRGAEARTRLLTLQSVEEELAGLPAQVRAALRRLPEGVAGLALAGVRVPEPWDRLLENLLGRMQHALWADRRARRGALRGGCFDLFFPSGGGPAPVHVAAARPLRALLEGDPLRCDALCSRLGEVYCVDSADEAARLAEAHPGALFLSRDGELHGRGYARVGLLHGEDAAGLLARRNAAEAAQSALQSAEAEDAAASAAAGKARAALTAVEEQLRSLEGDLREALAARERAEARVQDCGRRTRALRDETRTLEHEQEQLRAAAEGAAGEEAAAAAQRDGAEARRLRQMVDLEHAEAQASEREQALEQAQAALQEARLCGERYAQELRHRRERCGEARQQVERHAEERRRLERETGSLLERVAALRGDAEAARAEVRALLGARAGVEQRIAAGARELELAAGAVSELQARAEGEGARLETLLSERQELALQLQRTELARQEIVRGVTDEFQQPVEDLARGLGIAAAAAPDADAYAALAAEAAELREKLAGIGPVNLEAVAELEQQEQRAAFLERERDDLQAARANLLATIEDLDNRCRARFLETFEGVQQHFEGIFRRLFRGGKAELSLGGGADALDAGIEIHVRPPGKELRSINLLSGGERTLTALALLLAVFRSRPSPFCLLDEVDAALDDANVERFLDVLHDFTGDTQFLVVTHNKLTMARCERLFGVTMRRAGVSLVVAVELSEIPDTPAAAGGPGASRLRGGDLPEDALAAARFSGQDTPATA
ncbi:MAG: chromosome segregation protein SMC [Planctomycetota bacterium]|nr:MAG: chromosome segregation protein SMC [Planctomycetota bacterium]